MHAEPVAWTPAVGLLLYRMCFAFAVHTELIHLTPSHVHQHGAPWTHPRKLCLHIPSSLGQCTDDVKPTIQCADTGVSCTPGQAITAAMFGWWVCAREGGSLVLVHSLQMCMGVGMTQGRR